MNNAFALRSVRLALSLALLFIFPSLLNSATAVQDLRIGGYTLVSTRIDRHHYELAYSASLTNRGTSEVSGATARLVRLPSLFVVDGQLSFGPVPAGQTVTSTDTFTLRWPISKPINPKLLEKLLRWNIAFNAAPLANAGPDQTVPLGSTVVFDGTGSSDADGDPLTYRWAFTAKPASSTAALSGAGTAMPTFVADRPGNYDIALIVNDGRSDSTPDTVRISTANSAPSADAGPDQTALVRNAVTLDGTASSDVNGDLITYRWSFTTKPTGSQAVLSDPTASRPSFTVDKPGDNFIQLIVNDGKADSAPDSVQVSTRNSAPMANAGPDQSVFVNTTVQLDGSQSSDADGDHLTYRWSLLNKPANSAAVLVNDTTINPSFAVDKPGSYTVQLIVNDGTVDSPPDQIVVSTQNSRPVANAGVDQTAVVGGTVTLDGNGSQDADGDNLSFAWSLITKPANSTVALRGADTATPTFIPDQAGDYIAQLIVDDSRLASPPDTALVTVSVPPPPPNQAPTITSAAVTTGQANSPYNYDVEAHDPDIGDTLTYTLIVFPNGMLIDGNNGLITWTPSAAGNFDVTVQVSDGRGGVATQTFTISVTAALIPVPDVVGITGAQATTNITNVGLVVGNITRANSDTVPAGNVISQNPAAGTQASPGTAVNLVVSLGPDTGGGGGVPPDPATVAPPTDPTVATDVAAATAFLYTGANPIQTGVAPGTIEPRRVAVLRGKVLDRDGTAIPAVKISVLGHSELGQTLTRADGAFDLAVNGGGQLTLRYEKDGFLAAQRAIVAPWRDYAWLPDVVMIPFDTAVTSVDLSVAAMQVARGSPVSDTDGARRATILFPQGTTATMVLPDGTARPLPTLKVRATEYTIGTSGPKAMPAPLPPSSGYTYAAEFSVDEAVAAGATDVRFSQPLPVYVENFLGFLVGTAVPAGYYDRQKGQWIASANGRVIKVLGITNNLADLDIDGTGIPADAAALDALGVTTEERTRLALLYTAGQTLWRVPITHFTPWDYNWPFGPPPDAIPPPPPVENNPPIDNPNGECGSVIGCENQTLGESVSVSGTPFALHYQSERTPGHKDNYALDIPLSGATIPVSLKRIELEVSVAGQKYVRSFTPASNLIHTYTFDGKDAYGRTLQGSQPISVRIGYTYPGVYMLPSLRDEAVAFEALFGHFSYRGTPATGNRERLEVTLWQEYDTGVGAWDNRSLGLGGWSLNVQHAYDPLSRMLFLGHGQQRRAEVLFTDIVTVAGNGVDGFSGDGGPATKAKLSNPRGVAVGPDGSLYIADTTSSRVRRVGPDGIITTLAGNGVHGFSGDGGPATAAKLSNPREVAVGPDGSLYIADPENQRIRRVGLDGIITTVAGNGKAGFSGDGGPAVAASLKNPVDVAVGPDGSVYIADHFNYRIRRVGPDGIITTFAGSGVLGNSGYGDGGPATKASLGSPHGVAVGPDGSLYFADFDQFRVRRVGLDGIITTIAGSGPSNNGYSDGGPATAASLSYVYGVAVGSDGSLYMAEGARSRIRRVRTDGIITTVAGNGKGGFSGDGGPPTAATLPYPYDVAVGPDDNLYIIDDTNRIRRVKSVFPDFSISDLVLSSEDGREIYVFNNRGRHLKTLDALTGAVRYQFGYDPSGYLTSITDGFGNVTTIERSGAVPSVIVAPGGQRTALSVGSAGWLLGVTNPAGEAHTMSYSADGLLQRFIDPLGNSHPFTYDALGRLIKDEDPAGGSTNLTRTEQTNGYTVTTTSALGRSHAYQVEQSSTGTIRRSVTQPSGAKTVTLINTDGSEQTTGADGSVATIQFGPDPRWGMLAPVPTSMTLKTPGGLTRTVTTKRTATLSDPNNLLSLTKLTDTITDNGIVSTRVYDGTSRVYTGTTAAGRSGTLSLDAQGRITQERIAALAPVSYVYDSRGLFSTITAGSGATSRTTSLVYNGARELSGVSDALGQTMNFAYDLAGRLVTQTLPDGRTLQYAYDAAGNATALTPPGRPAHGFAYTPIDLMSSYTPPDVGSGSTATQYSYNTDRAPTRITRPDGQLVDVTYDTAGRMSTLDFAPGVLSYTYNATTSQLTGVTAPGGIGLGYSYDGALLTGVTWTGPVSGAIAHIYNNDLRVTTENVNGADSVSFAYDADGLLTTAGSLALTRSSQNGLLTGSTLGGVTDSLTYNTLAELTNYSASYTTTGIYSAAYSRDALGRITQKVETVGGTAATYGYSYDTAGRLSAVTKDTNPLSTYSYDSNGNRLTAPGLNAAPSYDDQDRLTEYGGTTYSYTANGELLSKTAGTQTTSYQYDALGNLLNVTLPGGTAIDYLIDGENRRIGKKVNGTLVQAFLYQGSLRPIAELDGANTIVSRFVYATHINVPDYMVKGGVSYRILTDHLGSPRLVVNTATGAVAQRIDYDEFGQVLSDTNPGFQPFGFAGGLYDRDTKLVRFGARDYDAQTGRWTAKDPILFGGGSTELYGYTSNDPINFYDPSGLEEGPCVENSDKDKSWNKTIRNWLDNLTKVPDLLTKRISPLQKLKDWYKTLTNFEKTADTVLDIRDNFNSPNKRDWATALKGLIGLTPAHGSVDVGAGGILDAISGPVGEAIEQGHNRSWDAYRQSNNP